MKTVNLITVITNHWLRWSRRAKYHAATDTICVCETPLSLKRPLLLLSPLRVTWIWVDIDDDDDAAAVADAEAEAEALALKPC